jgi:hypothetical protein
MATTAVPTLTVEESPTATVCSPDAFSSWSRVMSWVAS